MHQLAIALARAMHLRESGRFQDAIEALQGVLSEVAHADLQRLLQMSRTELLEYLGDEVGLVSEEQCGIADVLYEYSLSVRDSNPHGSAAARKRAVWIYEVCVASGATLPLHVHERLGSTDPESSDRTRGTQEEGLLPGEKKT